MFQTPTKYLIFLSGLIWFGVGTMLLCIGLNLFADSIITMPAVTTSLTSLTSDPFYTIVFLIAIALVLGTLKGRTILRKSAVKNCLRLSKLGSSAPLHKLYTLPFYALIGGMMLLGMGMSFLGIPSDIRGVIDVAVGSGLIQGALVSFRFELKQAKKV